MRKPWLSSILVVCCWLLVAWLLPSGNVQAHTPHDDVYGLEISPEYQSDQTAYAIVRGNFFRTVDGGTTWLRAVAGLDNHFGLHSLTMSPQNKLVLYISSIGDGVYKSVDGGERWFSVNNDLEQLNIRQLFASPISPDIVLAVGNQSGLYRTEDGGESWQTIDADAVANIHLTTMSFVSATSDLVYAGDDAGNLYRSADLGVTWEACCAVANGGAITALGFAENDQTFFVGTEKAGVLRTDNGGESFVPQNEGIASHHIQSILLSSTFATDNLVFVTTRHQGVFRSENGGQSWTAVNTGLTTNRQALDYNRPTFSLLRGTESFAKDQTLYLAAFTGIYKSADLGNHWHAQETLPSEIIVGLAVAPPTGDETTTVGVTHYMGDAYIFHEDGSFHVYVQQGMAGMDPIEALLAPIVSRISFGIETDRLLNAPQRLHDIAFSPAFAEDQTAYVSMMNYLLRTTDAGQSWEAINVAQKQGLSTLSSRGPTLVGYVLAPSPTFATDDTLFIGTHKGLLLKSDDRGETFARLGSIADMLTALQISPDYANDRTLFAAGYNTGVHRTTDGGATWQPVNQGLGLESGLLFGEFQLAISPNFAADQTIFLGTVNGLFKSVDGAVTWAPVVCGDCMRQWDIAAVAVSPDFANDQTVLVSSKGVGIYKSVDSGDTFTLVPDSLIEQQVSIGNLANSPATSGALKFSPNFAADQTVYGFSGTTLARSTDGGDTWTIVPTTYLDNATSTQVDLIFGRYLLYPLLLVGGGLGTLLILFVLWRLWKLVGRRQSSK